jgi:hypothetical protein
MKRVKTTTGMHGCSFAIVAAASCACVVCIFGGCVMQSTYDAVVQEGLATRTELIDALEEQRTLTRQLTDMEVRNADAVRDAEAAVAAMRQAQDEAERERRWTEQRLATLTSKVRQAAKQQQTLRYELTVAKEKGAALQELIDAHQQKLRDGALASAMGPVVHKPFDPSTIPLPEDLPPAPAVTPPQPTPAPTPAPPAASVKSPQAPPDEGWFMSIKNWLASLWRSVFS